MMNTTVPIAGRKFRTKTIREIVHETAKTFRIGAPITCWDIRVAAKADGYDLSNVNRSVIAKHLSEICRKTEGRYGSHDYHLWILEAFT